MSDEWMPRLKLKLARADFDRLPRHPAFKYELIDGETWISPWPRYCHAQLDLDGFEPSEDECTTLPLRPATREDLPALVPIFCSAFARLQPFGSLPDEDALAASERSLRRTFDGEDGPFASAASFVAVHEDKIAGAILVTLLPGGDPADDSSYHWHGPHPPALWEQHAGQPHLTWIFVRRCTQGTGIGTQLLVEAVRVLKQHSYRSLWTTFMVGNDSSSLWHWRNGFELLPYPFSKRRRRR